MISLQEIKHFLRITCDTEDNLLNNLLNTAIFHLEEYLSQHILCKDYEIKSYESKIYLKGPLLKVESITNSDGKLIDYTLNHHIIELHDSNQLVIIKYVAGLFENEIPDHFRIAILTIISHLYNSKDNLQKSLENFHMLKQYKL